LPNQPLNLFVHRLTQIYPDLPRFFCWRSFRRWRGFVNRVHYHPALRDSASIPLRGISSRRRSSDFSEPFHFASRPASRDSATLHLPSPFSCFPSPPSYLINLST